jgi:murein DD-endopeptidase MepM/ murein hydrolase activator NlpD
VLVIIKRKNGRERSNVKELSGMTNHIRIKHYSTRLLQAGLLSWLSLQAIPAQADLNTQAIALPNPTQTPRASAEPQTQLERFEFTIGRNQTLSHALEHAELSPQLAYQISRLDQAQHFTRLRVGDKIVLWRDTDKQLHKLDLKKSPTLSYHLETTEDGFRIYEQHKPIDYRIRMASATISDSFYLAGERAGLSARTIMNLADLFGWEVDFVRELREGDQFKIIYQQRYLNGEYLGDGDILAAELSLGNGQRTVKAFQLVVDGKKIGYFNEKGENLRKAFMRNPINYVRISSRFQRNRYHPVLKELRDHKGVDYAAPTGTPVYAAGDGIVAFRGWRGGYGNKIKLKHAGRYETVYGHFSRFGKFKQGQSVKQGDIIGYVGMTGLATGPHLHYEFRINGQHQDPLKVKFPDANPVQAQHKQAFEQYAAVMTSQLMRIDPNNTQLAAKFE